ncbi:DUF1538 domain-containing protein [Dethiobacter alkaliphilus]|uniref:DUF1538 domain-containing protein n=1 Tax=Dethiobacter alkaliphilus TaxID=427926 RepID=UPI00222686E7|nr:DUF1538 domain-containing protein [Dethiobacter alkaliphilus]MCW3491168.1 DUF1538 domain-containing protein [Dethiobacter alkaliphilus]
MSEIKVFAGFSHILLEVAAALLPLLVLFIFFQLIYLKMPVYKLKQIGIGLVLAFAGLSLFLQGVYVGFLPVGQKMGTALASLSYNWILIPIGFVLGFVATFAEPAVRVLNYEVEKASGGYIPQTLMLYTLSLGVAASIAVSMTRILLGLSLWPFIIIGYATVLIMTRFSTRTFTAIAFDSGGVATGPMTVTFISAVALGVATTLEGRDPLLEGFGMISLVALAPILSVLVLGLLYGRKERENEPKPADGLRAPDDHRQQRDGQESG